MSLRSLLVLVCCIGTTLCNQSWDRFDELRNQVQVMSARLQEQITINLQQDLLIRQLQERTVKEKKRFLLADSGVVAFTAQILPLVISHMHHNDVVKFDRVLTNIGDGYRNTTGVFVVPISGLYMFSCSLMDHDGLSGHGSVMTRGELVKNGIVLGRVFAHADDTGYRDQGAQTVIVEARQGDQVFVRVVDNQDLSLGGELYSSFSGYLLAPIDR